MQQLSPSATILLGIISIRNIDWFTGSGGVVVGVLLTFLLTRFFSKKDSPTQTQSQTMLVQLATSQSVGAIAASGSTVAPTIPLRRTTPVTLMDIHEAIMAAPLLQRAAVQEQYKGLYVEWDAYLQSARKEKNGDIVRLSLKPAKATEPGWLLDIGCKVSITDYKELSILKAGAPLRVSGRMAEVGEWNVELTDARLTFQGS